MKNSEQKLQEIRHYLHQNPELSNEEYSTTRKLRGWLDEAGIHVLDLPLLRTGLVAQIGTGQAPILAIRADIDALPIQEETGLPYSSQVEGKMHACGHDLHTAVILGAAYNLKEREEELPGTVRIIFQPAEETGHGAKQIINSGGLKDVEAIFGLHNWPELAVGELGTRAGAITAGVDRFEITIKGTGAHAASPEKGTDSIVLASQIVLALQTISSRSVSALESVVVSVTRITGGNTWNVLPENVVLEGTVRTLNTSIQQEIPRRMDQILQGLAAAAGAEALLHWYPGPPATINDSRWSEFMSKVADEQGYRVLEIGPQMGGEDFSFYLQTIPGAFVMIGSGAAHALHHPKFAPDETLLLPAAEYFSNLTVQALKELNKSNLSMENVESDF
ncbi:hydrolase [Paenibacillus albidus]|uniref:Hydrolase n=1 Tax=Paenibacillus albidus TaxID=2041023 RepID=A0A917CLW8_9BACL|nr:amidohydrolase [Paenibacillus albidus]GGF91602.1 hydrolase [Paenibacillus albidus]